jgi:hypothetical protein
MLRPAVLHLGLSGTSSPLQRQPWNGGSGEAGSGTARFSGVAANEAMKVAFETGDGDSGKLVIDAKDCIGG